MEHRLAHHDGATAAELSRARSLSAWSRASQDRPRRIPDDGSVPPTRDQCCEYWCEYSKLVRNPSSMARQRQDRRASESKERKLVAKDYIAHLIDAQRAVITTAKDYQLEARLLPEGEKIECGQASHRHLGRLQDRRLGLGTVWMPLSHWMARPGSRQDNLKTEEASTLLVRPISSGEDQAANSDALGPERVTLSRT